MYTAPQEQEFKFFSALIPAPEAPHTVIPRLEEFGDDDKLCSSRKVRRTEQGRCRDYHADELETADALVLLSLSGGGFCVSPSAVADSMSSDINSRDSESNTTETTQRAISISRDEKNSLLLLIKLEPKAKKTTYKCDTCDREFSSPQALGGHKTSHRHKTTTDIPDLNVPARVFECSICGEVYCSGPALGGHKRKHYISKSR